MKLMIIGLLACFVAAAWADEENDMYFTSSGDGVSHATDLPPDDEDTEEEASGVNAMPDIENIDIDIDPEEQLLIDPVEQPEEPGDIDIDVDLKNTRVLVPDEETVKNVPDEEAVKNVPDEEAVKNVDGEVNTAEQEMDGGSELAVASGPGSQFLAAVIVGGCIGLLFAICVIMLLVYRMRKKDEGSYALEYGPDSKKPQGNYEYTKGMDSKEYFA